MMTSSTAVGCGCSRAPGRWAACEPLASCWASTIPSTTAGDGCWSASDPSCSGPASGGSRGCRTRSRPCWSSGSWPWRWLSQVGAGPPQPGAGQGEVGGLKVSANGIWRVLKRHVLNTRSKRLSLGLRLCDIAIAGVAIAAPERHIEAKHPGHRVKFDNFYIGRLTGTTGVGPAVHHQRRGLLPHLGRAPRHAQEPLRSLDLGPGSASGPRVLPTRLATGRRR